MGSEEIYLVGFCKTEAKSFQRNNKKLNLIFTVNNQQKEANISFLLRPRKFYRNSSHFSKTRFILSQIFPLREMLRPTERLKNDQKYLGASISWCLSASVLVVLAEASEKWGNVCLRSSSERERLWVTDLVCTCPAWCTSGSDRTDNVSASPSISRTPHPWDTRTPCRSRSSSSEGKTSTKSKQKHMLKVTY